MPNKIQQAICEEIDDLVSRTEKLALTAAHSSSALGPEAIAELGSLASRSGQLIRKLYSKNSQYHESLQRVLSTKNLTMMHSNYYEHVSELTGILKGVQHELKAGLLVDIRRILQADIFSDFLEMSEHLLTEGYKDAAAVLLGAVLEDSLRKMADANQVNTTAPSGRPLSIDPLNVALAKSGIYGPLIQKQITTWAHLRNDAAHGHFNNYDDHQVKQMLLFLQKFCSDYLQ